MAGLVPAIHAVDVLNPEGVDARDKRGHDGAEASREKRRPKRVTAQHLRDG